MSDVLSGLHLIPYCRKDGRVLIYLQKRGADAPHHPGCWALFGGGHQGEEAADETLLREIKEELDYTPTSHWFLGQYSRRNGSWVHVFVEEVLADFETKITVREGECGRFFTLDEAEAEPTLSELAKMAIRTLSQVV